jgi:glucosamine-6-phosphate deaminase
VVLDEPCRRQQVNEGHFATDDDVPRRALTVTIPALLRAGRVLAVVPEARKAAPVRAALEGPVSTSCPASILQRTPHATVFLEPGSAQLLSPRPGMEAPTT